MAMSNEPVHEKGSINNSDVLKTAQEHVNAQASDKPCEHYSGSGAKANDKSSGRGGY